MLVAHLKRILKLDRLRLWGLSGEQDKFLLVATAQNLRRMAKWLVPRNQKCKKRPLDGKEGAIPDAIGSRRKTNRSKAA